MKYMALERIRNNVLELSVFNTSKDIMEDQKARGLVLDYVEKEIGKNYQIVGNGIEEK